MSTFVDGADVRPPAEAQDSAAPPSMAPDPADEPDHREKKADSGSLWLQDEIARRIAAKNSGSGGRHARRDNPDPSTAVGYVPRHSTAPGPVGPPPVGSPPVGPPPPPALPRRGSAGANSDNEAWTGPDRSARDRPVLGGPSRPAGLPAQPSALGRPGAPSRPSGPAAARLLSAPPPPAAPVLPGAPVLPAAPVPTPPPNASAPTSAWPVTPARPLTPPGGMPVPGGPPPRDLDPGPLTAPVLDGPVLDDFLDEDDLVVPDDGTGEHDEILWSADALPPPAPADTPPGAIAVPEQRVAESPRAARFPRSEDADPDSPKRVRVVLAERKGVARPVRTVVDIQEATAVGALLRSNLIGSQLTVALRFAAGAGLTLGVLPLLFTLFPAIGEFDVLGFRLPWLLLGFLVYPFLFVLGWWHTRTAERVEQNFADHVQE